MKRRMQAIALVGSAALAFSLVAGCGGDDPPAASSNAAKAPPKKKPAAGRAASGRGRGTNKGRLDTYAQIEDRFRLPFSERDFTGDPGGDENRDPFRSYVIRQGAATDLKGTVPIQPTDVCTERNSKAPAHSIRELRLMSLVLLGTRSFAQFRDPAGFGWIVKLRDCVGKEKAIVEKIGAGFVTLEVVPEMATSKEAQAERRDIQLHPTELRAEEEVPVEPPRQEPPPAPAPASKP